MHRFNKIKFINIFLIVVMLGHLTFLHNILQNYVICFENDGNIQVENINDCSECTNFNLTVQPISQSQSVSNADCLDIPLDNFCSVKQFIYTNKKIDLTVNLLTAFCVFIKPNRDEIKSVYPHIKKRNISNIILENYSSVSLLI